MKNTNKKFKRIIACLLTLVTVFSAMSVSMFTTSAAGEEVNYNCVFYTHTGRRTVDKINVKITGTEGTTDWHNVGSLSVTGDRSEKNFTDVNVGEIQSITVKKNGSDDWYPEWICINGVTVYGGRWVTGGEVTMSVTDNVYDIQVYTGNIKNAGTDLNVYAAFIDDKGNKTHEVNLSDLSMSANAFEKGSCTWFKICVPDDFGRLSAIEFSLSGGLIAAKGWNLGSIKFHKVSGTDNGVGADSEYILSEVKEINRWFATNDNNYTGVVTLR